MARTAITVQTLKGPFPGTVAANGLDFTWTAGDAVNNNEFTGTGREILLVRNDDGASARAFTLVSVADPYNRAVDITSYSVGIGEYAAIALLSTRGWRQTDGKIYFNPASANLKFAVLRLP